jgi:hypothetical protein
MLASALRLAALLLLFAVPAADAASFSDDVPVYDASDGVTIGQGNGGLAMRFAPKAAPVYRSIAGRRATVGCTELEPIGESGRFTPLAAFGREGVRLPRRRSSVNLWTFGMAADVCTIAVNERRSDRNCVPPAGLHEGLCLKAVVARTLRGRLFVARTLGPDAMPPAGEVGYWTDGRQFAFSVLDLAGRRLFFSATGEGAEPVISTNVPEITGPALPAFTF